MVVGDVETAKPLDIAPDIFCAICLRPRDAKSRKIKKAVNRMLAEYEKRRAWLIPALQEIEGAKCSNPEGAFYALVDVRGFLGDKLKTSADIADLF